MTKRKLALKITAGIAGLLLVLIIFSIGNAFMGNPISAMLAKNEIQNYVDRQYSTLHLELSKVTYNFKFGSYGTRVTSKTSGDTHFHIDKRGKNIEDTFASDVLNKMNTLQRFEQIYTQEVASILREVDVKELNARVMLAKEEYEKPNDQILLDMPFDKKIPIHYTLVINLQAEDTSVDNIASIIKKIHSTLIDNGCTFETYSFYVDSADKMMITDITPQQIESPDLVETIQKDKY